MKTLATRASFLVLVLAILQVLTTAAFPVDLPPEILRLDADLAENASIVYLGDSTITLPAGEVTTGEILKEMLPECTVAEIAHPAYNLHLYQYYVRHIVHSANPPRVIVVPVNMRSFSPEWDRRPGYQFVEEKVVLTLGPLLSQVLWRPMQAFGGFEPKISQEAFLDTPVYREETQIGTVRDFEQLTDDSTGQALQGDTGFAYHDVLPSADDEEALQQFLTYRYLSGLHPDHRQLKAMLDIAEMGQEHDVRILFYITPVNYQQGQRYVGDSFREVVSKNVDVVKSLLLDQTGIALVDLAFDLEAFAFVDMEHLRETGKEYVAVRLAAAIKPGLDVSPPYGNRPTPTPTAMMDAAPSPTVTSLPVPTRSVVVQPTLPLVTVMPEPTVAPTPVEEELPSGGALVKVEYLWRSPATGKYAVDVYRLQYETIDHAGEVANILAELYVPYADTGTNFPLILHAAGTTGIGNGCAPLKERELERNWGRYDQHSLAYASQGYVVVLPNGLGFDNPDRSHRYFVAELEARTLLDAARAVYALAEQPPAGGRPIRPNDTVFVMGYSSGGHAAFAVKDWAESYAPEVSLQGVIGFGPTTNVETLLREDPVFAPYLVYAYRDFYGSGIIGVADVFAAQWVGTFESDVLNNCVDDIFVYYTRSPRELYTPTFNEILYGGQLDEEYPLFAEALSANASGLSGGDDIPVLILQGTADTVVTPDSQRGFRDLLCALGDRVSYFEYTAVAHTDIRWSSFGDVLVWMDKVREGVPLPDSCEGIRSSE